MKIGIDVRVLKNKQKTGVEEYTIQLLRHLLKIDQKNEYILFYTHLFSLGKKLSEFTRENVSIRHIGFSNKILSLIWKFPGFPPANWLIPGGVDVFFSPHINILPVARCRKIVVVHDLAFLKYPSFFTIWKRLWHSYMANSSIPQADTIIAVSKNTKKDIMAYYQIAEEKIKVIYPGVNIHLHPFSQKQKEQFRKRLQLPSRYLFYLGTLEPRKNIETIILAFARLKAFEEFADLKFIIVGKLGWLYKDIFRLIKKYRLQQDVIYQGYIREKDKNGYFACAECFVYPSYYEGFGFPPLEAFAVGTPVITSNTSSIPEVTAGAALEINPTDEIALSQALRAVLTKQEFVRELVHKGFQQVRKFQWSQTAKAVLDIIED